MNDLLITQTNIRTRAEAMLLDAERLVESGHRAGDWLLTSNAHIAAKMLRALLQSPTPAARDLGEAEHHLDLATRRRDELAGYYPAPVRSEDDWFDTLQEIAR